MELCKHPQLKAGKEDKIADFFEHDFILLVNIDKRVGVLARKFMMSGFSKLKPPDASHLAAACIANVEEMHTFDDKLLALDGKLDKADGTKLKICRPGPGGPPLPLLKAVENG